MKLVLREELIPQEMPALSDLQQEAAKEARQITIGTTLFMKKYGVHSEAEYKKQQVHNHKIMHHAHIGWNSWEETAKGFRYIYDELGQRGIVLDRFGVALDWVMGVPESMRDKVLPGGSLIFKTPEEWAAVGQVVPIQPHFGDHMIGSLNSTENVKLALQAGVTTIGNISQYYTYEYPGGLMSREDRVINMVKAIAIMACFSKEGAVIHSNLDDGYGGMFHDLANMTGWAMLERYIIEELMGAREAQIFGNLFSDPMLRIIFSMTMDAINTHHTMGSMINGNTIDCTSDFYHNYATLSSYLIADTAGQLLFPTGHAVAPVPITEAVRIPSPQEIVEVHCIANAITAKAEHYAEYLNLDKMKAQRDQLLAGGKVFFERILNGLDDMKIDIKNPCELFMALKGLGAARLEELFGAGQEKPEAMRGHIPVHPTDIVWTITNRRDEICKRLGPMDTELQHVPAVVACTDVHEFGKEIVKSVLTKAGMDVFDLGANVLPSEIADTVIETDSRFVLVSTFNGIALTYAKQLLKVLKQRNLHPVVIMGGLLNENLNGEELPVPVEHQLTELGIICSKDAGDLVQCIRQRI